jgi:hypothetical protein
MSVQAIFHIKMICPPSFERKVRTGSGTIFSFRSAMRRDVKRFLNYRAIITFFPDYFVRINLFPYTTRDNNQGNAQKKSFYSKIQWQKSAIEFL